MTTRINWSIIFVVDLEVDYFNKNANVSSETQFVIKSRSREMQIVPKFDKTFVIWVIPLS